MIYLQNDVELFLRIEAELNKKLEKFDCKENEVIADITKVKSLNPFLVHFY